MLFFTLYYILTDSEWVDSQEPDDKVGEFEQWKKQQKMFGRQQVPSDEAPPRVQDEVT